MVARSVGLERTEGGAGEAWFGAGVFVECVEPVEGRACSLGRGRSTVLGEATGESGGHIFRIAIRECVEKNSPKAIVRQASEL